jgi:hypothetical protein
MKKRMFKPFMLALGALSLMVVSCKKDDVKPTDDHDHNDVELITTLELKFSGKGKLGADTTFVVTFNDPDGDGGNAPTQFETIHLLKNSTYKVEVTLLDKSKSPADTISNEVLEEANDHLFFYSSNPTGLVNVAITDKDGNGKNLGLKSTWTTTNAGSGKVKVKLMHQPGVKDGTSATGDTDIEVDFQVNVK